MAVRVRQLDHLRCTRDLETDRHLQTTSEVQGICRNFVWGVCSMNENCRYRHELDYESMKAILKFCHDYQNKAGCTRPECTYLHVSQEEENLFLTDGVIPRVLAERYASMANNQANQIMNLSEHIPPPPPSAQNPGPSRLPGPIIAPQMMPVAGPSHILTNMPAFGPVRFGSLMPPPPPPPLPPGVPMPHANSSSSMYKGPQPLHNSTSSMHSIASFSNTHPVVSNLAMEQPQPSTSAQSSLPTLFDPSRPPPPVPSKRPLQGPEPEAGPSKLAKIVNDTNEPCSECIVQQIRIAIEKQEVERLEKEEDRRRQIYQQKLEEYEKSNLLLKSMFSPSVLRVVNEFLDSTPQRQCIPKEFESQLMEFLRNEVNAAKRPRLQGIPKQFLFQFMEFLLNKVNAAQSAPSLESRTRQTTLQIELIFASIMELLENSKDFK